VPLTIRQERPEDEREIAQLLDAAFGDRSVSEFARRLRSSAGYVPELSFVAEDDGAIVGFALLTRLEVEGCERRILTLGPVGVRPDRQRSGVGSAVVRAAVAAAEACGEPLVLVEGVPSYYPRFGFRSATALGLVRPDRRIPEAAWLALPLGAYDADVRGRVVYPGFFPPPPGAAAPHAREELRA
jgi:putative acetyltransferase